MRVAAGILVLALAFVLLSADAAASRHHRPPCWQDDRPCETLPQRLAYDAGVADRTWPASSCVGHYTIVWGGLPDGWDGEALIGNVDGTCTIRLARYLRDFGLAGTLCRVLVHEAGHLSGQEHSADPRSIMTPTPDDVRFAPCSPRKWWGT